jgi:hypothetical protein
VTGLATEEALGASPEPASAAAPMAGNAANTRPTHVRALHGAHVFKIAGNVHLWRVANPPGDPRDLANGFSRNVPFAGAATWFRPTK